MALMPKRVKYRKQQRRRRKGKSYSATLNFGEFGLKALETAWMTDKQIEAARVALMRETGRAGKLWIRVFPDKPVTATAAETRMARFALWGGLMLGLILLNFPASCLRSRYMSRLARGISRDLRVGLARQLQQLTLLYHSKHSVGRTRLPLCA